MIDDYKAITSGTIVISAHGISDKDLMEIRNRGLKVINLTCPLVNTVHDIAKKEEKEGRKVVVFGDKNHTEVKGIIGNLNNFEVIKEIGELKTDDCKISLVSQTTRDLEKFENIAKDLKEKFSDVVIKDTICFATKDRQKSAIDISKQSDIMIVIGSKLSSNTLRLKEICSKYCESIHIETEKELKPELFYEKRKIGITAGASTPDYTITKVKKSLEMII